METHIYRANGGGLVQQSSTNVHVSMCIRLLDTLEAYTRPFIFDVLTMNMNACAVWYHVNPYSFTGLTCICYNYNS